MKYKITPRYIIVNTACLLNGISSYFKLCFVVSLCELLPYGLLLVVRTDLLDRLTRLLDRLTSVKQRTIVAVSHTCSLHQTYILIFLIIYLLTEINILC